MKTKYNAKHFFKLILSSCKGSILTVSVIIVLSLLYSPVTSMATDLSGNLNAIDTLKLADSPFTVIANISWTSGTHVIEPGVIFMFDPNTGFEIAQANVKCEGTVSDSIVFTSTGGTLGTWNGVYFSNNSDNGVSSTMSYTRIEKAGNGTWNSNLYCASTIMPNISYSSFIEADGNGIRLDYSPRTMSECVMELNSIGLNINYPNGTITTYLNSCTIQNNTNTGLHCNSFIELTNSLITNNTVYEVDAFAPNGFPLLNNSFIQEDGTSINRIGGGIQSVDRTWPYNSNGYEITGVVYIYQSAAKPRLTINAGITLRFETAGKIFVGNSSSYGGELHALGTVDSVITFTALNPAGNWEGIQFSDGSDSYSASSSMQYCIVEKGNSYNVYCVNNYNAVVFDNCEFNNAAGEGIEMYNAAITVNNSLFQNNHTGLYLNSGSGITYLDNCTVQNNTNTGIRSNVFIELTNSLITNNNVYEVDAFAPNGFPLLTNSSILEDATSVNRVGAGTQSVDRTWPYNSNGYEITGVVNINKSASNPRLTINAGSTLRFEAAGKIIVGNSSSYGGELHALGTVDSVITFTALNPANNWEGIAFNDGSDSFGASSNMQYCTVEKGNSYNVYCINNYNAVVFDNCEFNNAAGEGIEMYNAAITVNNSLFQNNHTGLFINNSASVTYLDNCTIQNNTNTGLRCNTFIELTNSLITNNTVYEVDAFAPNGFPLLTNSSILEDATSVNRVGAGTQTVDRIWPYNSNGYEITGVVYIYQSAAKSRLTINAGSTLRFEATGKIIVGNSSSYGGELHALGTVDSVITFTALNPAGNWEGIQFSDGSDSYSASSSMQYCTVEKGNSYNVYCINNYNAVVFDNCEFNNAAGEGIEMYNAAITVNNSLFQNNHTGLSLTSSNVNFITYLDNCTIQNNTNTGIRSNLFIELTNSLITNNTVYEVDAFAPNGFPLLTNSSILEDATSVNRVGAGTQSVDRTWPYNSNGYEITGVVNINKSASNPRLTINAGSTLRFETAGKITIGNSSSYGGELHAMGTADSLITFTALNPAGNWEGIHFNDGSDSYGATCSMQHCVIDKGNSYNVYCSNTSQPPVIKDGIISNSAGIGLSLYNSSTNLEKCQVINNVSYGIYINGNSNITIGNSPTKICDLYYNGEYDVYNNSTNYIPAGSNFWNTSDTGLISSRIYDKNDEFLKGLVYHYPIKHSGFIPKDEFDLDGKVIYNNMDSTELNGFEIIAMDVLGNIKGTATTNASGDYSILDLENAYYIFSGSGVTWGGSNSTDALKILQHFAFIDPLTGINLGAADVNGSNSVNGTDALMVLQRFSALISSFPAGDWILSDSATLYGNNLTINQLASCYGDVNGSFTPPGKEVSTITLIAEGSMGISSFEEYEIPIKVKNGFDMGALSLILTFPDEFIEIDDVILADGSASLIFNVNNGIISMAWANLNPLLFDEDEILLTLKIETKDLTGLTGSITFGLEAISEMANSNAEVIQDVILTSPLLEYGFTLIDEGLDINNLSVFNYPEPFNLNTTIEYTLPHDGSVILQVFNSHGRLEHVLIDEFQNAGKYKINFNRNKLQAGLYFYKLKWTTKEYERTVVGKMLISM